MVIVLTVGAVLAALIILATFDQLAQANEWRLGRWTQLYGGRSRLIDTPWIPIEISGGCEECGTSWRYVRPHLIPVKPYGQLHLKWSFCEYCHTHMSAAKLEERYAESWLATIEALSAEGKIAPDAREWAEIRTMLRVERDPLRVRL